MSAFLDGRVAVVTGGSSGMGAVFAEALASHGASVVSVARRASPHEGHHVGGGQIRSKTCDVTDPVARELVIDATLQEFGQIDILVNNAGTTNVQRATEEHWERFAEVLELNLVAPFALCQLVAPQMLDRGEGTIVNVASIAGLVGMGRMPQAAYTASKSGLIGLTRELALQWARKGIRVNALAPGFFPTEMTSELFDNSRGHSWVDSLTPMGRAGALDELVGALLYLVDPRNSYTTGTTLPVDGGWTAA